MGAAQTSGPTPTLIANQIAHGVNGPFDLTLIANPITPLEGLGSRFSVRVLSATTKAPVTDASVDVIATAPDGKVSRAALTQNLGQREWYESPIGTSLPGRWSYVITAQNSEGLGTLDASLTVLEAPGTGRSGTIGWAILVGVVALGGVYFWWRFVKNAKPG